MTVQGLLGFYDNYLTSNRTEFPHSNPIFDMTLTKKVNDIDTFWKSQNLIAQKSAELLKKAGNNCATNNQYREAIRLYKRSIEISPDYVDVYFNLAKAYRNIGEVQNAIDSYKVLLEHTPSDVEALTNLGECYRDNKELNEAKNCYKKPCEIDPKFDLASRNIKEIENLKLAQTNPQEAYKQKMEYADSNLKKALELVVAYAPQDLVQMLGGIKFVFGSTEMLGGQANIAQYENDKSRIVVTENYIWAAPEVIAAYLVNEAVHAKDKDPYTSITEEQDAYRASVIFWLARNNGIKDPEMDYAASLYLISPEKLNEKVEEVYTSRDKSIPKYSPHHGIASCKQSFIHYKRLIHTIIRL